MNIETLAVGLFGANCHIAWGKDSKALIIDPGGDPDVIMSAVKARHLTISAYLLTHGHMDHIDALADMYEQAPAPIGMHSDDLLWAFSEANILPPYYTSPPRRPPKIERSLTDGQKITDGGLTYEVLHTPGHSPGCACFYFAAEDVLFTGDTLFAGSVGRTDLPGGNSRTLARSLARLATLPDSTLLYPGHGPDSTMAQEKRTNMFMAR